MTQVIGDVVSVRLDVDTSTYLRAKAQRERLKMSDVVRIATRDYVERELAEEKKK